MLAASDFFRTSNYLEAGLWGVIAAGFVVVATVRAGSRATAKLWVAAVAFALFGVSDVVEVRTGAWWRPWWLLVWKGACVLIILLLYIDYLRLKRRKTTAAAPASASPDTARPPASTPDR